MTDIIHNIEKELYDNDQNHQLIIRNAETTHRTNTHNILRKIILSPIDLLNTYIGKLPKDILQYHLYQYINIYLVYYKNSLICPYGHITYNLNKRIARFNNSVRCDMINCVVCEAAYVIEVECNYSQFLYKCLFVIDIQINNCITHINSYKLPFYQLFFGDCCNITAINNGKIINAATQVY